MAITVDDVYPPEEELRLSLILEPAYRRTLQALHELVAGALELDPEAFRLDDISTRQILQIAAERVVRISDTTRQALRDELAAGQEAGESAYELAQRIDRLYMETWAGRALMIARTEIGEAQRVSALNRYKATGLVDRVGIIDGDDDEPCASRNGTVVAIDKAPGLAHPNCTLVLYPVLREGVA